MSPLDLGTLRLHAQRLVGAPFASPTDVVDSLGAVQAQDYYGAKWALAQRTPGHTDANLDRLCDAGAILRTHILRPTWHFVRPADIRWMLRLTSPRVHAFNAYSYRREELDADTLRRTDALIAGALEGGKHLTRDELRAALAAGGMDAPGQRLGHALIHAELNGLICSGPRRGKQSTHALLEERVPPAPVPTGDEALALLTRRYFEGHGPAVPRDMAWWSGLTQRDVKRGISMLGPDLEQIDVDGTPYWWVPRDVPAAPPSPTVRLLPNYDEYFIAFKDHRGLFDPAVSATLGPEDDGLMAHFILLDGQIVGGWRRTIERRRVVIKPTFFTALDAAALAALRAEADRYGQFLGLECEIEGA